MPPPVRGPAWGEAAPAHPGLRADGAGPKDFQGGVLGWIEALLPTVHVGWLDPLPSPPALARAAGPEAQSQVTSTRPGDHCVVDESAQVIAKSAASSHASCAKATKSSS